MRDWLAWWTIMISPLMLIGGLPLLLVLAHDKRILLGFPLVDGRGNFHRGTHNATADAVPQATHNAMSGTSMSGEIPCSATAPDPP